jgi:hypothetical protein
MARMGGRKLVTGVLCLVFVIGGAGAAFAANPTTAWSGCMKAWTPYKVAFAGTPGWTEMEAKSTNECSWAPSGQFQNCLERSSWSGYVKHTCNAWHPVGQGLVARINGCLKGTYDYHTRHVMRYNYLLSCQCWSSTSTITSAAYYKFYCSSTRT